jgi:hypothetical protein
LYNKFKFVLLSSLDLFQMLSATEGPYGDLVKMASYDNRLGTDWRVAKIDSFGCWLSLAPGFLVRAKLDPRLDRAIVSLISLK